MNLYSATKTEDLEALKMEAYYLSGFRRAKKFNALQKRLGAAIVVDILFVFKHGKTLLWVSAS